MNERFDSLIVSAFGRGHWMAAELARQGFSVALVDVTDHLGGRWTPEDWCGPFGFLKTEGLKPQQQTRLLEEGDWIPVENGFQVLTEKGPLDCQGPLSSFLINNRSLFHHTQEYINVYPTLSRSDKRRWAEILSEQSYESIWPIHLAHQLASPVYKPNAFGIESSQPLPLFSPHYIRRVSRKGLEQLNTWVQSQKVKVFEKSKIKDIVIQKHNATGFEIQSSWSGILHFQTLIWCLSSEETRFLSPVVAEKMYPKSIVQPEWVWVRYRYQISSEPFTAVFPKHMVLVGDLGLSWTHANLMVMQKTSKETDYDVWVRIPAALRFQRNYLQKVSDEISVAMKKKWPLETAQLQDWPQDYHYTYEEIGPARFPVFNEKDLAHFEVVKLKNAYMDSCEFWPRMDGTGQFQWQETILDKVSNDLTIWKEKMMQKERHA